MTLPWFLRQSETVPQGVEQQRLDQRLWAEVTRRLAERQVERQVERLAMPRSSLGTKNGNGPTKAR